MHPEYDTPSPSIAVPQSTRHRTPPFFLLFLFLLHNSHLLIQFASFLAKFSFIVFRIIIVGIESAVNSVKTSADSPPIAGRLPLSAGGARNPPFNRCQFVVVTAFAFMGDLRDWLSEAAAAGLEKTAPSPSSHPESDADNLQTAEEVTQGIIARIQPNTISEQRRRAVIDYVKRLLCNYLGCEVGKNYTVDDQFQLVLCSPAKDTCIPLIFVLTWKKRLICCRLLAED